MTINGSTNNSNWTFKLEAYELPNSVSIENNTSVVRVDMYIGRATTRSYIGGNYNASIVVDGQTQSFTGNIPYPTYINSGEWYYLATRDYTITHNSDGSKTAHITAEMTSGDFTPSYCSASGDLTLTTIPRYTTITSFSVDRYNETSFIFNWTTSDIVDYVWYSTNNGSSWEGYDVTDGTSGNFVVNNLNPNTTYNCKIRVRRKDSQLTTDSNTISQTTYKAPTQSVSSKTETSISMTWTCDGLVNNVWYSVDNGTNWIDLGSISATSGSYTIDNLTPDTTYNIKTRIKRSSTNTTYDTSVINEATYDYPYCINSPDFTIGDELTLEFYNPLNRLITITGIGDDNSQIFSGSTTGTSVSGFNDNTSINSQYASIPNSQKGVYQVQVTYNSITKTRSNGNTYKIIGTETPTFSDFDFVDSNNDTIAVTGDNQVLIKNKSTLKVIIDSSDKMIANNSATENKYNITCGDKSAIVNYSSSTIEANLGTISSYGTLICTTKAIDSRNLSTSVSKNINVVNYSKPTIIPTISRVNNFESSTNINCSGTFAPVVVNNTPKNDISTIEFRYKKMSDNSYSNWTSLQFTTNTTNGTYEGVNKVVLLDNTETYSIQLKVTDALDSETMTIIVSEGVPIMFISSTNKNVGIGKVNNNEEYSLDVKEGIYCDTLHCNHYDGPSSETILYDDSTGSNTTIILNDSTENYKYIEIFFMNNDGYYNSVKVYEPHNKSVSLVSHSPNSGTALYIKTSLMAIYQDTMTLVLGEETLIYDRQQVRVYTGAYNYITRVVGYK